MRVSICKGLLIVSFLSGALALATMPRTAWLDLEDRAATEGAQAVRADYEGRLADFEAYLQDTVVPTNPDAFVQRAMAVGGMFQFGSSWSFVEARAILRGDLKGADSLGTCEMLIDYTALAGREFDLLTKMAPSMESRVTPEHSAKYGPFIKNVGSLAGNKDEWDRRLAILSVLTGAPELTRRVFESVGGSIRFDGREFSSASEFMKEPPDFGAALGLPPVEPATLRTEGQSDHPDLSEDEEQMSRDLIRDLFETMVAGDRTRMAALFDNPSKGASYAANLDRVDILEIDLAEAVFEFRRVDPEQVDVLVADISMIVAGNGERVPTRGRKSFRVIFLDDGPRIVGPGGM